MLFSLNNWTESLVCSWHCRIPSVTLQQIMGKSLSASKDNVWSLIFLRCLVSPGHSVTWSPVDRQHSLSCFPLELCLTLGKCIEAEVTSVSNENLWSYTEFWGAHWRNCALVLFVICHLTFVVVLTFLNSDDKIVPRDQITRHSGPPSSKTEIYV